jgi:aminoglycoside 3-N-acetyltransferase
MDLYMHKGEGVAEADFGHSFVELGVKKGDTLFVHSDIKPFGKIATSKTQLLRSIVEVLEESVGPEGAIVMPTFSYSFCKGEIFDRDATPSTVGVLGDFFRKEPGVTRSVHPLFSVAAWGKDMEEYLRTSKDSFGAGTVFETLHRKNGKILLLGTDFQSCTFLHYTEQIAQVPYRYLKTFSGTIVDADASYKDAYTYFVRPIDGTIDNDFRVIEPVLRERGVLCEATVGGGKLMLVSANELFDVSQDVLKADPYFFVKKTV